MTKLILLDIDGTLVNDEKIITKITKDSLIKAQEQGIKVAIASGRAPAGIEKYAHELEFEKFGSYISAQNGSILIDFKTKEKIADHRLDYNDAKDLLAFTKDFGLSLLIYMDGKVYTDDDSRFAVISTARDNNSPIIVKKDIHENLDFTPNNIVFCAERPLLFKHKDEIIEKFGDKFDFVLTSNMYFEAMPKGITKATSLDDLCSIHKIEIDDTIAFGDSDNDVEMLQNAGLGIAMQKATKSVLAVADLVCGSNNEDGIGHYLIENIF